MPATHLVKALLAGGKGACFSDTQCMLQYML
jgi:hypothetical protein